MSHMTVRQTSVRSLDLAIQAMQRLGIPLLPHVASVKRYYSGEGSRMRCDAVFGHKDWDYNVGLAKQDDGTYAIACDVWGMSVNPNTKAKDTLTGKETLSSSKLMKRIGDDFNKWKWRSHTDAAGKKQAGHVGIGTPNNFLQQYSILIAEATAMSEGSAFQHIPQPNGDIAIRVTGGKLRSNEAIILTCHKNGTTTVQPYQIAGPSCKIATQPYEDAMGAVVGSVLTPEYNEQPQAQAQAQRIKRS